GRNPMDVFLEGVESFGVRDQLPSSICNAAPSDTKGVEPVMSGDHQCVYGYKSTANIRDGSLVPQNNEVSNVFFDWRAGAEYDLAEHSMLYGTVTTGHKGAGFNDTVYANTGDGTTLFNSEYRPESVIALEVGSKNLFLDKRLRVNAAAFAYKYNDQVFQTLLATAPDPAPDDPDVGPPAAAVRDNVADTLMYGLETTAGYDLPLGFQVAANVLLLNAKFADHTIVSDGRLGWDISDYQVDIGGKWLPRVSPFTANYAVSQHLMTKFGTFDWVASGQTRYRSYMTVFNGRGNEGQPGAPRRRGADLHALRPGRELAAPQQPRRARRVRQQRAGRDLRGQRDLDAGRQPALLQRAAHVRRAPARPLVSGQRVTRSAAASPRGGCG
ncbi:MAG: TonB-dependent receptor, partial [Lysobacter sp.]|nr:TonB-dependent receptor [Lysobacter sp.]